MAQPSEATLSLKTATVITIAGIALSIGGSLIANAKQAGAQTETVAQQGAKIERIEQRIDAEEARAQRMEIKLYRLSDRFKVPIDDIRR